MAASSIENIPESSAQSPQLSVAPQPSETWQVRPEVTLPEAEWAAYIGSQVTENVAALKLLSGSHNGQEHLNRRAELLNKTLGRLGMHDEIDDRAFAPLLHKAEDAADGKTVGRISEELGDDHPLLMILEQTFRESTPRAKVDAQLMMRGALLLISNSNDS